ncbi:N-acetylglucosamine-6-phosphate deacetylase [Aneurinibacillus tyrosinisolvens]|uniref:N-acetylglucosamine-6-phosphate deacetylase n=1 Tax=Aneurinibacillus tyrosinisolvens TaxID=1443435 RepID=UPI00063F44EB|nr:N-acetylglucosamine-6-phosphate deacetylase [Aneurinibacillus tyrosinisolvens]
MENRFALVNAQVFAEQGSIEKGYILIDNGKIIAAGVAEGANALNTDDEVQSIPLPPGCKIIPGMIDVHIHGAAGADTMDATEEALHTIAAALPREGTTSFLATTMTQESGKIEKALGNASAYLKQHNEPGKAEVLGLHLEGPFLSPKRAGAQPLDAIIDPDTDLFKTWQTIADGMIKLVTLAPERDGGMELAAYLKETGVVASVGHSDATYAEVVQAIEAGVTHATHLFNGMRGLHHREPGVAGAVLLHDEIVAEMIADGIHVRPEVIQLTFRQKGRERLILVTDAMRAKCLGSGVYSLGGQDVQVDGTTATLKDGTLAGSILKMRDAIANVMSYTKCGLEDIVYMTAVNPAKQLNVYDRKGSISPGKDADIVVLDENNEVYMTFCRGVLAFANGSDKHEVN